MTIFFDRFFISSRGQGALAMIFLIGGTSILIAVSLAFFALTFTNITFGFQAANKALAAASSGVNDALIKIIRDKDFAPSSATPTSYTLDVDGIQVKVELIRETGNLNKINITSTAVFSIYRRRLSVSVLVDDYTGKANVISWRQVAF